MSDKILYYYHPDKNPTGAFYPGVPLGDLTEERFKAQPRWIQQAIEDYSVSPYRKTKPHIPKEAEVTLGEGGAVVEMTVTTSGAPGLAAETVEKEGEQPQASEAKESAEGKKEK